MCVCVCVRARLRVRACMCVRVLTSPYLYAPRPTQSHPDASPREVAAALTRGATLGALQDPRMRPGTPNRLLYSRRVPAFGGGPRGGGRVCVCVCVGGGGGPRARGPGGAMP